MAGLSLRLDGRVHLARPHTLVSVLAYAGLRPQEALALQWRHVRERTLLVEQAATDGRLKRQKTNRSPRSVELLAPLREDLAAWRAESGPTADEAFVFARADGGIWREDDWRNWRKRIFAPAAKAIGILSPRAYDLRHSFASLRIHEGDLSIVELAEQLGHNPSMCLSTYAHVMAELRGAPKANAEEQIIAARAAVNGSAEPGCGPNAAYERICYRSHRGRSDDGGRRHWRSGELRCHARGESVDRPKRGRRDQVATRAASRLVASELSDISFSISSIQNGEIAGTRSVRTALRRLPTAAWTAYRRQLATALKFEDWVHINEGYNIVRRLRTFASTPLMQKAVDEHVLRRVVRDMEDAQDRLAAYE